MNWITKHTLKKGRKDLKKTKKALKTDKGQKKEQRIKQQIITKILSLQPQVLIYQEESEELENQKSLERKTTEQLIDLLDEALEMALDNNWEKEE